VRPLNSVSKLKIQSGEQRTDHSLSGVAAPVATIPESFRQFRALSLQANFSWTFVGNMVYSACQWGMLAVIAKLGTPEAVGRFALGLAITAPVIMFANLQLRVVQATDAKRHYCFGDYLGLRLITTLLSLVVIAGIALSSGYKQETVLVVWIVGLSKAFEAVSDVLFGLLQQRERMDRIAVSLIIKGVFSVVALGVMFYVTGSLVWGLAGLTVVWAAVLVGYDIPNARSILKVPDIGLADLQFDMPRVAQTFQPRWDKRTLGNLARLALPLGFVMLLVSLNVNIPRYFLEHYQGERDLGIFAALAYMMVAGRTVMFALGWAASPRLATYYAARDLPSFRRLLVKLAAIGLLLGMSAVLVVLVAGRLILTLLYGPEYAEHTDLFIWLTVAAGIGYVASLVGYGVTAAQYFKSQMVLFVLIAMATVLASILLIPSQGLQGAAVTLLVAALIELFGSVPIILYAMYKLSQQREEAFHDGSGTIRS
jgi:O-antigen/teichoic acid export membrane protein